MLCSQPQDILRLNWTETTQAKIESYPGIHELSNLTESPTIAIAEGYAPLFPATHSSPPQILPSNMLEDGGWIEPSSAPSPSCFSEETVDGPIMLVDRPRKKRSRTTEEDNPKYRCAKCGTLFKRSYNLKNHQRTHDVKRVKQHKCHHPKCDKEFDRKADLIRHDDAVSEHPAGFGSAVRLT